MTDDMNEKLMQEYLEGRSPVSESYRAAGKPGPSAELDRAVLAEARAAAQATGSPQWQTWLMPASLAATFALCIALVAEVVVFDPLLKTTETPQTFTDAREADTPASPPPMVGRQSSARQLLEQIPQRSSGAIEAKQEADSTLNEVTSIAAMAEYEAPETAAFGQARENLNAPALTSDRMLSQKRRAVQKDDDAEAAALTVSVQLATSAAGTAGDPDQSGSESAVVMRGDASEGSIGGTASQASGGSEEIVVTARSRTDSPAWPAADVWLAGIRFLFEQGEQERAEAELDKFREHYPDYPLGELVQGTDED